MMKTFLFVPFEEKDDAKRLGARWDIARKRWYVDDLENLEPFLRWMPENLARPVKSIRKRVRVRGWGGPHGRPIG